jgi:hypothetical protein
MGKISQKYGMSQIIIFIDISYEMVLARFKAISNEI